MRTLKLTQIGNSVGVILPKEVLVRLKVQKANTLHVTDTPDGIALTPHDPTPSTADDAACVLTMLDVAAGEISEETFAGWVRRNSAPA